MAILIDVCRICLTSQVSSSPATTIPPRLSTPNTAHRQRRSSDSQIGLVQIGEGSGNQVNHDGDEKQGTRRRRLQRQAGVRSQLGAAVVGQRRLGDVEVAQRSGAAVQAGAVVCRLVATQCAGGAVDARRRIRFRRPARQRSHGSGDVVGHLRRRGAEETCVQNAKRIE